MLNYDKKKIWKFLNTKKIIVIILEALPDPTLRVPLQEKLIWNGGKSNEILTLRLQLPTFNYIL